MLMRPEARPSELSPFRATACAICGFLARLDLRWLLAVVLLTVGCSFRRGDPVAQLPADYQVKQDQLIVRSDSKIAKNDPVIRDLEEVRSRVQRTLRLPPPTKPVVVYLFRDERRYADFMQAKYPNLPPRRAFFIGTSTELAVYAFWGDKTSEDLRHEYTHGLLHASLKTVPLWLDEGLAEYFETPSGSPGHLNPEHTSRISLAMKHGWTPDLARLEKLEDINEMQRSDYQEAWAWVHYLLHGPDDGQTVLLTYVKSLRTASHAPSLASSVRKELVDPEVRLVAHLQSSLPVARGASPVGPPEAELDAP
jgi:hypothetical protein